MSDGNSDSDKNEKDGKDKPPGFTFTKSAIADLPSTAVQSIHIENDTPVEVDDEVFVWRDVTPSGTKLASKAKFKKQECHKTASKQQSSNSPVGKSKAKDPPPKTSTATTAKTKQTGSVASKEKVHAKTPAKGNAPEKASSLTKVAKAESKSRVKERRPSQTKASGGGSATKVTETRPKGGSQTKVVQSREKNTAKDKNQSRGK